MHVHCCTPQDALCIVPEFDGSSSLFGVFDGHGGKCLRTWWEGGGFFCGGKCLSGYSSDVVSADRWRAGGK